MLAILEADRVRVAELQTQIAQLERKLAELRLEQSKPQGRLDAYKYPVLILPNEIVSEIFIHVVPPYPGFPQLIGPCSPNPLTQICQRWRKIALAIPELWRAISSFYNNRDLRIVELWLERSRHCPLSISLGLEDGGASDKLVETVIPHRARWEYVNIALKADNLRILDGPMPLLRYLELALGDSALDSGSPHDVPLLRTVVLSGGAALRIDLPWAQLTTLILFTAYPSECVSILIQAQSLVHCQLDLFFSAFNAEFLLDITLLSLESLVLSESRDQSVPDFLPTLIAPALRSLKIPENFLLPNPIDSLTSFVSRSGCSLKELHLTGERLLPENSYSQAFPSLCKLSFDREMAGEDSSDSASSDD
ncbi:hypothetical protein DFH06DRAFT_1480345 [Mycena polygramma]|nr:hypothetical protein DFH06DRAFT_1480345 [Mycena polygramma]